MTDLKDSEFTDVTHEMDEHLVEKDHQTLDNQVNEYFREIEYSANDVIATDDEEEEDEEAADDDDDDMEESNEEEELEEENHHNIEPEDLIKKALQNYKTFDKSPQQDVYHSDILLDSVINSTETAINNHVEIEESDINNVSQGIQNQYRDTQLFDSNSSLVRNTHFCKFCGKTFKQSGSLGRHLDRQKGNKMHPTEDIDKIRAKVARRGNAEIVKERRLKKAYEYNRREYVKEKNRLRRKLDSKTDKLKRKYESKFYKMMNHPTLPLNHTFPRMALFYLPPNMWPNDPPNHETFERLASCIEHNEFLQNKNCHMSSFGSVGDQIINLEGTFADWQTLTIEEKSNMWIREQRNVLEQIVGDLTVFDFAVRDMWEGPSLKQPCGTKAVVDSNIVSTKEESPS